MRFRPTGLRAALVASLALLGLSACSDDDPATTDPTPTEETRTISEIAAADGELSTLVSALEASGLDATLEGEGPFTVLAPTNAAFDALPEGALDALLADADALERTLLNHVIAGESDAEVVSGLTEVTTQAGETLEVVVQDGKVIIGGAMVTRADIQAANGIIHVIDAVLTVPDEEPQPSNTIADIVSADANFSTLLTAVVAAGLDSNMADPDAQLTVFAPTNAAFDALPEGALDALLADTEALTGVLLYHVTGGVTDSATVVTLTEITMLNGETVTVTVEGDAVKINDATITTVDIEADNGIIHVIDRVLLPGEEPQPSNTIADIVAGDENFSTLLAAVTAADLAGTLADADASFTVFAPTDAAFDALPEGALDGLLADTDALTDVLLYHVADGEVDAATVVTLDEITMLNGDTVMVTVSGDTVMINDVMVTMTDIMADNGIIHVIDGVLLPPEEPQPNTIADIVAGSEDFETLLAAVTAADLAGTLADPDASFTVFAPTDAAFAALPEGALDGLLADTEALTDVLLYHIADGEVDAATVVTLETVTMLNGDAVTITVEGDVVRVNDAAVTMTDIMADNGIIHVIDAVLLPPEDPQPSNTIADIVAGNADFETLLAAVTAADLAATLADADASLTVFAPTDDAFAALPDGMLDALLADTEALTDVLLYHVAEGEVNAETVVTLETVTMLNGQSVAITVDGDDVFINGAQVVMTDIVADNGIIHVIDAVLVPKSQMTIAEIVSTDWDFATLSDALVAAGLDATLADPAGSFTVFAPTNDAFAALPAGTLEALLADPSGALTDILLYHVVGGEVDSSTVVTLESATTLQGADVAITVEGDNVFINGAMVLMVDVPAANGIIHVIDAVLLPPEDPPPSNTIADIVVGNADFETLLAAVTAADLVGTLSDPAASFTVFAPTDDAFAALPDGALDALLADTEALTDVLLYHVADGVVNAETVVTLSSVTMLNGDDVTIEVIEGAVILNGAVMVTATDIEASNGIVHVIDAVLLPPEPLPSIAEIVAADADFSTLLAAVSAAGLVDTLSNDGPFTVFAPTDAAFAALPDGTLDALLADPSGALTEVLLYHVVEGMVPAEEVVTLSLVPTLSAIEVKVTVDGEGNVFINDAQVVVTNVMASNGIVHVIDTVLVPPPSIAGIVAADPQFSTLLAAVSAAGLVETLDTGGPFTVFAPTDAAFAALPEGTLDALLADPAGALTDVLLYHVVDGRVDAATAIAAAQDGGQVMTLNGMAPLSFDGVTLEIDGAVVVVTDIPAYNGTIHVIDAVLVP